MPLSHLLPWQGLAAYTVVPVDECCRVDPEGVAAAITPSTVLVTIMHSNNEVGAQGEVKREPWEGEGAVGVGAQGWSTGGGSGGGGRGGLLCTHDHAHYPL